MSIAVVGIHGIAFTGNVTIDVNDQVFTIHGMLVLEVNGLSLAGAFGIFKGPDGIRVKLGTASGVPAPGGDDTRPVVFELGPEPGGTGSAPVKVRINEAELNLAPDGRTSLAFQDAEQKPRIGIMADRHGMPLLSLIGADGHDRLQFKLSAEDEPLVVQTNSNQRISMILKTEPDGDPLIEMADEQGNSVFRVPAQP